MWLLYAFLAVPPVVIGVVLGAVAFYDPDAAPGAAHGSGMGVDSSR